MRPACMHLSGSGLQTTQKAVWVEALESAQLMLACTPPLPEPFQARSACRPWTVQGAGLVRLRRS